MTTVEILCIVLKAANAIKAFREDDEQMWLSHEDAMAAEEALRAAEAFIRSHAWV